MMWWLPFIPKLLDLFIKRNDPAVAAELEIRLKTVLAEIESRAKVAEQETEKAHAEEFARFIEATQPSADRVYVWMNSLIAAVRPAMAIMAFISPWLWPDIWLAILQAIKDNSPWSLVMLTPVWVWVLGRDGLRMVVGAIAAFRSGTIPDGVMPPGLPPVRPTAPKPAVRPVVRPVAPPLDDGLALSNNGGIQRD